MEMLMDIIDKFSEMLVNENTQKKESKNHDIER
jgi:hypothetical protein